MKEKIQFKDPDLSLPRVFRLRARHGNTDRETTATQRMEVTQYKALSDGKTMKVLITCGPTRGQVFVAHKEGDEYIVRDSHNAQARFREEDVVLMSEAHPIDDMADLVGRRSYQQREEQFNRNMTAAGHRTDREILRSIATAINDYYLALNNREHGGVAESNAFNKIQKEMGMYWVGQVAPDWKYAEPVIPARFR
jgi:hypothetical protein